MKMDKRRNVIIAGIIFCIVNLWVVSANTIAQNTVSNGKSAVSKEAMATTAHPLATEAAVEMLHHGGNAVDAAVAAAFAIGVVEPDGSGLGGGGGMVIYLAKEKKSIYINYYQRASENIYDVDYNPQSDNRSAKAILVPGTVAGLTAALEQFGTLPLATVLAPAIRYAEEGFPIDETLSKIILDNADFLQKYESTAGTFLKEGFPLMEGDSLRQPELAATLRSIAQNGRAGFYEGVVAETMVRDVVKNGGMITLNDLKNYRAVVTEPLKGSYRGYNIITANAPQSGSTILEALNILENVDLTKLGHYSNSTESMHLIAEAMRRAYADRGAYLDDPKFEPVPLNGLISKKYARTRFDDIDRNSVQPADYRKTKAGNPTGFNDESAQSKQRIMKGDDGKGYQWDDEDDERQGTYSKFNDDLFSRWGARKKKKALKETFEQDSTVVDSIGDSDDKEFKKVEQEKPGAMYIGPDGKLHSPERMSVAEADPPEGGHTTHLSVVDKEGNAVSLTQTLGTFFGSGLSTAGVLMNCGMSNYSVTTAINSVKPNKQPRSSISPTIILKNGKVYLTVGSPGATRIIATVIELIVNVLDFNMPVDEANNAPRFLCQKNDDYLSLESRISETVQEGLKKKGHHLKVYGDLDLFFGGAQMILYDQSTGTYYGSADPRRGGVAIGD